ncbi:UPF0481 protein At3g47200-like [Tasmannia lanceolata]|uniref:UPF0481 protein At3g47200-like n=1 Tax=Tasmannia lanceolata TaxID=3420 RepID=UPI004062F393
MGEEATTVRNRDWVIKLEEQVLSLDNMNEDFWKKQSIYRVPTYIKDLNIKAYEPQLVSLGPYHHGIPKLMAMEEHKYRALHYFLKRSDHQISFYVEALEEIVEDLMGSYEQLDEKWRDRNRFLQLMILDGSFLLEILQGIHFSVSSNYAKNDPICSKNALFKNKDVMMEDMLMIENQVPLMVLTTLLAIQKGRVNEANGFLNRLVFCFFLDAKFVFRLQPSMDFNFYKGLHLLDLTWQMETGQRNDNVSEREPAFDIVERISIPHQFHVYPLINEEKERKGILANRFINETVFAFFANAKFVFPLNRPLFLRFYYGLHLLDLICHVVSGQKQMTFTGLSDLEQVPSASSLHEKAQVELKKSETKNLVGISFKNGVLTLPAFRIHSSTESVVLNMVAFEYCHPEANHRVSSYIDFMSALLISAEDSLLIKSINVVETRSNDKSVSVFIQKIRNDMGFNPGYGVELHSITGNLNRYYIIRRKKWKKRLHEWRSNLKQTYFKNPWTFTALIAATLLLVCTIFQTVTGVLSLKSNHN